MPLTALKYILYHVFTILVNKLSIVAYTEEETLLSKW